MAAYSPGSAAEAGYVSCHSCGQLSPVNTEHCPRCQAHLHVRKPYSLQRTLALLITATLLYIPANVLPIMVTSVLGNSSSNTILSGVAVFWSHGDYPVALIIFIASVVVPVAKIMALFWLCHSIRKTGGMSREQRTRLYRVTEFIGRWSMVDVFVVAVLVALIQLGNIMSIQPGAAALAFAGVVIVTMLAAMSFDPRLIWDKWEYRDE